MPASRCPGLFTNRGLSLLCCIILECSFCQPLGGSTVPWQRSQDHNSHKNELSSSSNRVLRLIHVQIYFTHPATHWPVCVSVHRVLEGERLREMSRCIGKCPVVYAFSICCITEQVYLTIPCSCQVIIFNICQ